MLPFTIIVNHSCNNNKKINCHFKCLLCPFKCSVNLFNSPMKLLKIIFNHTWLSFFSNLTSYPPAHLAGSTFKNVFHYILNIYRNIYSHILVHLWPGLLEEPPTEALTLLSLTLPVYSASLQRILFEDGVTLLLKTFNNCPSCWGKYQVLTVGKTQYLWHHSFHSPPPPSHTCLTSPQIFQACFLPPTVPSA